MKKMYSIQKTTFNTAALAKFFMAVLFLTFTSYAATAQIGGGGGLLGGLGGALDGTLDLLLDDRDGDGTLNAVDIAPDDPCVGGITEQTCCTHRGQTVGFTSAGGNVDTDHSITYVMTTSQGVIEAISETTSFENVEFGLHHIYAINYQTDPGITGLTVGANLAEIEAQCAAVSDPLIVHNCSELPTIDNHDSEPTAEVSYQEGSGGFIIDMDASDPEGETENGGGLTYSLSGLDALAMSIDAAGVLTFNEEPDFENLLLLGLDNTYEVTVIVTDSAGGTDEQTLTITVEDTCESEAPVLSYEP